MSTTDAERDDFLTRIREPFNAGEPLTFVADIVSATELEQVLVEGLELHESNDSADSFRYVIRLRQYVEPPEPPPPIDELGADLGPELDLLAGLGLDGLEIPSLLGDVPSIGDPTPPLLAALDGVKGGVAPLQDALAGLGEAFA